MTTATRGVDVAALHQRAVAASSRGKPAVASRLVQRALTALALSAGSSHALRVELLITLANAQAEQSGLGEGLRVLEAARDAVRGLSADDPDRSRLVGTLLGQQGLLLARAGRYSEALSDLDQAVAQLRRHPVLQARALLNRGSVSLLQGDLRGAAAALERCAATATDAGWHVGAAKALGNLGYLALLRGDLPRALRLTDESDGVLLPLGGGVSSVSRINRARMLLAAGLLSDADAELRRACWQLSSARVVQDHAEAQLIRAQVALADDRPADARRWARAAKHRLLQRGADGWVVQAELIEAQANRLQRRGLLATADATAGLVVPLLAEGLPEEARFADLVARDCALAARRDVQVPRLVAGERIASRLLARAVRGDAAESSGATATAARERACGLMELHRYQSRFGSLDLQTGASGLGRRLAYAGLAAAVSGGRPAQVLAWSERARATTSRTPPLRPPADPVTADLLADLRYVRTALREADLARRDDEQTRRLRTRRRELESTVRRRSWYAQGPGEIEAPARLDDVRSALAAAPDGPGTLVSYLTVDDMLHALVVTADGARICALGPAPIVAERVQCVRADLDVLALSVLPAAVRDVASRSLSSGLTALERLVWSPLGAGSRARRLDVGRGPVLVVPCAEVAALPWTMLPPLHRRPVTVAPSATCWLSARKGGTTVAPSGGRVFVSGPEVERGQVEVQAAAAEWGEARLLTGDVATGANVLAAIDGAALWHVAAHGTHDRENPLFSSLQLVDGALFGYDLDGLADLPKHVVLSACDLGLATVRRRDEAVGMTAALLHGGTVSVVAGMARVADEAAFAVGVRLHQGLRAGLGTAQALAAALAAADDDTAGYPAPLVCFGAGW